MPRLAAVVLGFTSVFVTHVPPVVASPNHRAALSIAYGSFAINEETAPKGPVLDAEYEYFFSEAIAVRVAAGGGIFFADERSYTMHGVFGFSYTIDNLRYVPYFTAGIGGMLISDERVEPGLDLFVETGVGLDVILSRELALGVVIRMEAQPRVSYVSMGVRIVWRWGR